MAKKKWLQIFLIILFLTLIILSPFLPGPGSLSQITNTIYTIAQFTSILLIIAAPVGIIITVRTSIKKRKISKYLILSWIIPITTFCVSMYVAYPARNFSRKIAIDNADPIIRAIEAYYQVNKKYPEQLSELLPEFLPVIPHTGIMGIPTYAYEKRETSFAVIFYQNVILGFNKEIVSYDPRYQYSSDDQANQIYPAGKGKWQYYILD